ncbi:hypothetical protein [Methanobrevibacter sp. DSM 116169]|uniref:hypothetical protein n=1 Tax=Methanobrevibacter sp. DSM 116169 TaxID=3242727 RepID=UPI0038FC26C2
MNNNIKEALSNSEFFEEAENNVFIPKYLGIILNGVVIFNINWIVVNDEEKELFLVSESNDDHPIASITYENLESLLIVTEDDIKKII